MFVVMENIVKRPVLLGPSWFMSVALFGMRLSFLHQLGPSNICSHTTKLTTPMYFN